MEGTSSDEHMQNSCPGTNADFEPVPESIAPHGGVMSLQASLKKTKLDKLKFIIEI